MVQRTHKYADGGKIVKDHGYEKPTYMGAVKDRIKSMLPSKKQVEGAVRKAAPPIEAGKWKSMRDRQIEEAGG
jgi:hypothetical protein